MTENEKYMNEALKQAQIAYSKEEVPIGAVIVKDGKIIARAYNKRELNMKATAHSEIIAIEKACKKLNNWRLNGCKLFVTLEPCPMCAGAILNSRIDEVIFGAADKKSGAVVSNIKMLDDEYCNHKAKYQCGVLKGECETILKDFFRKLR